MSEFTETNRQTWNEQSAHYDSKNERITQIVAQALQERKDWIDVRWAKPDDMQYGRETRLLDYACGTGSITKALGPWVSTIKGIDISENMVQKYNESAQSAGLKPERVNAVVGDLIGEDVPEHLQKPEYYNFDLAVVGLGFHHFENPVRAIERLTERLKPGTGTLLIIDFLPFDDEQQDSQDVYQGTIKHRGFASANLQKLYRIAKLEKFSFSLVEEPAILETKDGPKKRTIFIARGKKEATAWGKVSNWMYGMQMNAADQFSIAPREAPSEKLTLFGGRQQ